MEAEIYKRSDLVFRAALSVGENFKMLWCDAAAEARGEPEQVFVTGMEREAVAKLITEVRAHRPVWAQKMGAKDSDDFEWRLSGDGFLHISFDAPRPEELRERLLIDKEFRAAAQAIVPAPGEAAARLNGAAQR
jgi:hypothetical protein